MKKILVTGAAGYIGSLLVTELVERNFDVTVIDNLMFSKNSLLHLMSKKNFNFIFGDVTNKRLITKHINTAFQFFKKLPVDIIGQNIVNNEENKNGL